MPIEPTVKRTVAFIDGQNLYHHSRAAFGYNYPNYDVQKLARAVCVARGWTLHQVNFYTGVPDQSDNPFWHSFWTNKLAIMGRRGIRVYSRSLVYRNTAVKLPTGGTHTYLSGEEKGIDVRLALDALDSAHRNEYDVALVFSQDQDLNELASLIRTVATFQNRWIKIASAYPDSPAASNRRGINGTDWCRIDRATYDACIDLRDYRPKAGNP
ncbi:MAG TPA: NYN domain-containing protein [Pirellulales bacterium]|nr:NYN domain-containing protein [Pirellulales bacterium]